MDSKSIKQNETILLCISLIYFYRDSTEINSVKLKIIFVLCINLIYLYRDSSEITSVYTTVPAVWCEYSPQFTYFFKTWKFLSNLHLRGIKVKSNVQKIFKFHVLKRKLEKSFTKP